MSFSNPIIYTGPVGVEEPEMEDVRIYPNPVNNILNIEWKGMKEAYIYNSMGRLIGHYNNVKDVTAINLENLPTGVYLIMFHNNDQVITKKLVKN